MSSNGETVRDEHMLEGTGVAISIFVVLKLQHTCIAGTNALQHTMGRCCVAVDLYPVLQERGWDGHRP